MSTPTAPPAARLSSRLWVTFSFAPEAPARAAVARGDHYVIDSVAVIRGAGLPEVSEGWAVTRVESEAAAPPPGSALSLIGSTQQLQYTTGEQRDELLKISSKGPGKVAVLIPLTKSEAWWSLPQDRRQEHFRRTEQHQGHTALGAHYAERIFRRLYHARYLPESSWDFLTYFEMAPENVAHFRELLAALRNPKVNPEWAFVERECEVWMRRI